MSTDFDIQENILISYKGNQTEIQIPNGVIEIGCNAFCRNKKIVSVHMPDSVGKIGSEAFKKCIKLKEIIFSKNIIEISYDAFSGCKALKEVDLPDSIQKIGSGAFAGCEKLTRITCDAENFIPSRNIFKDSEENDTVGIADKDGYIIFAKTLLDYIGDSKEIIVPDGVKYIGDSVFKSGYYDWEPKYEIERVVIPNSVKYIGKNAFMNCKNLTSIEMPSEITIGEESFSGCTGLVDENGLFIFNGVALAYCGNGNHVNIPEGTKVISARLFATTGCVNPNPGNKNIYSVNLPESLEEIGDEAFAECTLLESIVIPDGVKKIGAMAFKNCEHLIQVTMSDTIVEMGQSIFIGCPGLADEHGFIIQNNVIYSYYGTNKEVIIPEGITEIVNHIFNNKDIVSVKLPSTLKKLGAAFIECKSLVEITIPEGITTIEENTFTNCTSLKKISLPSTLKHIGYKAFWGCESLVSIQLPVGMKSLGIDAFSKCKSLVEIIIPEGLSVIEQGTFKDCISLKKIGLPSTLKSIRGFAFDNCVALESVQLPVGMKLLEVCAFLRCKSLRKMEIPEGIKQIKDHCFEDCESLEAISLPHSLEKICKQAFLGCINLKSIDIWENVSVLEDEAFADCKNLSSLNIAKKYVERNYSVTTFSGCTALYDKNGMLIVENILLKYEGHGKDVVVPEGIVEIAPKAFMSGIDVYGVGTSYISYRNNGSLQSITLPKTLKRIGKQAFCGCETLQEINFPEGIEIIGEEAFLECLALKSITLPASITEIGCLAFNSCDNLTEFIVDAENSVYASDDGVLLNKEKNTILWFPAGKKLTEYIIPEHITTIGYCAFINCKTMKKITIPATVSRIEYGVFPRSYWHNNWAFEEIDVDPKAGADFIGNEVFSFKEDDTPLFYPKLPITFVQEQSVQMRLALAYCLNPSKYEGEYAIMYEKYAKSHEKSLIKKAAQLKLEKVKEYFTSKQANVSEYKPELSIKKPSELRKVELLEEVVQKGTLKDLQDVLKTYKKFEIMERALGIAARYRGIDYVKVLMEHGATFKYKNDKLLMRKYKMSQFTVDGMYQTAYYLMIIPEQLDFSEKQYGVTAYSYSPMCGVSNMNILPDLKPLNLEQRIEVSKFFAENSEQLGVSMDEMLFWALSRGELEFADALIEMGVNLQNTPPTYYVSWRDCVDSYQTIITESIPCVYWNDYVLRISSLKDTQLFPVLERFHKLAQMAGKKLKISQKMFDVVNWNKESLTFILENADIAKITQKKVLEMAVMKQAIGALKVMAQAGWLKNAGKRERLIDFAQENQCIEALSWLLDFKNKTVDIIAEQAKEEEKMFRELNENPNSVSALKKIWNYKKLEDGTLHITSYKGTELEVEIPHKIGKSIVSVIGDEAFECGKFASKKVPNKDVRKKITSIVIPEGVTKIGQAAFYGCEDLSEIVIPSTVKDIDMVAFRECKSLEKIKLPEGITVERGAFAECDQLLRKYEQSLGADKFTIISGVLVKFVQRYTQGDEKIAIEIPQEVTSIGADVFTHRNNIATVKFPENIQVIGTSAFEATTSLTSVSIPAAVKVIKEKAFYKSGITTLELHFGLECIEENAFEETDVTTVIIPDSVKHIGAYAFNNCKKLRDIYIPASVTQIDKEILGGYDLDDSWNWYKPSGIYVHTPAGSVAEEYIKQHYSAVRVVNDDIE